MSAGLNTVAGTLYEDFVMLFYGKRHSDVTASLIMKIIVLILGIIAIALVFVVEKLGAVLQVRFPRINFLILILKSKNSEKQYNLFNRNKLIL